MAAGPGVPGELPAQADGFAVHAPLQGLGRALGETIAVALVLNSGFRINWHLTEPGGDCWARLVLRMREVDESLRWLDSVLGIADDQWAVSPPQACGPLQPGSLCVAVCEGFRGPVLLALETGRDGRLLHCEWHNRANRDPQGRLVSLLSFAKDLTRQLEAERARDLSEARYAHIFNNSHAVMLILDPESGRILDANPAAEEFYGWSRETLQTMQIGDINTLSPQALLVELKAAHAEERKHFEFRHRRADGSVRDVEVHSGPTEDGNRSMVFSIVHDITERKQAEALSRRWERFFRLSNLGLAMHDVSDNTIIDVNATYASQHGYSIEELRGMRIDELYPEDEREQLHAHLAEADRIGNASFETVHLRKDGSRLPLVIGVTALLDDRGRAVARFAFGLDISARKAAEDELRKLSRAVEESPESIVITNTRAEFILDLLKRMDFPWLVTVGVLHYISLAHLVGGLMLTIGLLTRIAAWVQLPILAGALFIHRNEGLMSGGQSLEFSALVFFLLAIFAISGSGALSVDNGMPKLKPPLTP